MEILSYSCFRTLHPLSGVPPLHLPSNSRFAGAYLCRHGPWVTLFPREDWTTVASYSYAQIAKWDVISPAKVVEFDLPVLAPVGLSRNIHDRTVAIQKRKESLQGSRVQDKTGTSAGVESGQEQGTWDGDDVMIFFWGKFTAAKERRAWKVQENAQRMGYV